VTVKAEKKRTNQARAAPVTKSTDDAVGGAYLLYLNRCCAFACSIRSVQTFHNDPIKVAAGLFEPLTSGSLISRCRRKAQSFGRPEIQTCELFEKLPAFPQRLFQVRSFTLT